MSVVSVIIPTHNRWPRLRETLDSALQQKGVEFEVLVVDDGSTDATAQEIRNHYPTVKLIKKANGGPSSARNLGIRYAEGTWIAFLDSDDLWLPDKLKAQIQFFADHPEFQIAQTEEIWIRKGVRVNPMKKHRKFSGLIFEKCLPLCIVSPSAVMIHRQVFEKIGTFDESLPACEDYDLWLRISSQYSVGLLDTPYVKKFGGHLDQLSHRYPVMDQFRIRSLAKILSTGTISSSQAELVRQTLKEKSQIVIAGALKHGNLELADEIETLLKGVGQFAPSLSPSS